MAKQVANEMVLKEVDTFLSDQRFSLAVVTFQMKKATLTLWRDQVYGLGISVFRASFSCSTRTEERKSTGDHHQTLAVTVLILLGEGRARTVRERGLWRN